MKKKYILLNLMLIFTASTFAQNSTHHNGSIMAQSQSARSVQVDGNVLNYIQDDFGLNLETVLTDIGLTVTTNTDFGGTLETIITSQAWDLIILQVDSDALGEVEFEAITTYVENGGKIIFNYWNMNDATTDFQELMGISNTISFEDPMDVTPWDTTNPIFNNPNTITNIPVDGSNIGVDNGDMLEPTADATVIAGFTANPTTDQGAIILTNNDFSIYHGFSLQDMDSTVAAELIENEVEYLLVTLSTEESHLNDAISVFPNPTSENVVIQQAVGTGVTSVSLIDVNGRTVSSTAFDNNTTSKNINISALATGVYFMKIETATSSTTRKIIKK